MRELSDILAAYRKLSQEGKCAALATVVAVEGPSYRCLGAKMLVAADGSAWGGISGGCLEKDVARRARAVIDSGECGHIPREVFKSGAMGKRTRLPVEPVAHEQQHGQASTLAHGTQTGIPTESSHIDPRLPVLCRYETGSSGEYDGEPPDSAGRGEPGASMGCGGTIEIMIERLSPDEPGPLAAIERVFASRARESVATVFRVGGHVPVSVGDRLFSAGGSQARLSKTVRDLLADDLLDATELAAAAAPRRHVLPEGWFDVLIENLRPPPALVIFGEGNDVQPLLDIAAMLGWHTTVVGNKSREVLRNRFPAADVVSDDTDQSLPEDASVVVMTHDFGRDRAILGRLAANPPAYVGVLGPSSRTSGLLAGLLLSADPAPEWLHTPVGLDIGADTPQAIALSIITEIQAARAGRTGGFLRDRTAPIYDRSDDTLHRVRP